MLRNEDTSAAKAKQAIADYKKAVSDPAGAAELMVFYCERAAGFCRGIAHQDASYFDALARMFQQAVKAASTLPESGRDALIARLDRVRGIGQALGYGVGDDMDSVLARYKKRGQ